MSKREFLKKGAIVTAASIAGAALTGGLDKSVFAAPPAPSAGTIDQQNQVGSASCIVWVDSKGNYYVKDTGIGPKIGNDIVSANIITAYGSSLGAGTAGASTTTGGIQEAIKCAGTAGGGRVILKSGNFIISAGITDAGYPNVTIEGSGKSSVISCTPALANNLVFIGSSFWVVRNLTIDCSNQLTDDTSVIGAIEFGTGTTDQACVDNLIIGGNLYGIEMIGVTRGLIRGNIVKGLESTGAFNIEVTGYPPGPNTCSEIDVIGNICEGNGVSGLGTAANIQVEGGAFDINIIGNVCSNSSAQGINIDNGYSAQASTSITHNVLIQGNAIRASKSSGIKIDGQQNGFDSGDNISIIANSIDSPMDRGIYVLAGNAIAINENRVYNAGTNSIDAETCSNIQINGNFCYNGTHHGIFVLNATDVQANNNTVLLSPTSGYTGIIISASTYFTANGNKIVAPTSSISNVGIQITTSSYGTVTANNIRGTQTANSGILLHISVTDVVVAENFVKGFTAGTAIQEDSGGDYNMILNNDLRGNAFTTVSIVGTHTQVKGNLGFNIYGALSPSAPALPGTGLAFPTLPYDAVYVVTTATGITSLALDTFAVGFAEGTSIFVAARHALVPTYTGSPVFEILPI